MLVSVFGTIEYDDGSPAAGVRVTATSTETSRVVETTTNAGGGFRFELEPSNLEAKQYYVFECPATGLELFAVVIPSAVPVNLYDLFGPPGTGGERGPEGKEGP